MWNNVRKLTVCQRHMFRYQTAGHTMTGIPLGFPQMPSRDTAVFTKNFGQCPSNFTIRDISSTPWLTTWRETAYFYFLQSNIHARAVSICFFFHQIFDDAVEGNYKSQTLNSRNFRIYLSIKSFKINQNFSLKESIRWNYIWRMLSDSEFKLKKKKTIKHCEITKWVSLLGLASMFHLGCIGRYSMQSYRTSEQID